MSDYANSSRPPDGPLFTFQPATQQQSRLRLALIGPAGSGKTYSALQIAQHLGPRVALIDTEHGSASKYASLFCFDVLELTTFDPRTYVGAIQAADAVGYDVLIIDSLSHAWMGKDGALELVDRAAKRSPTANSFAAWRDVTPLHNALVDAILASRCHVIATLRAKTEYVQDKDEKGKTVIRKVGLAPVQRDGLEYEFDVVGDLDQDNTLIVTKTRCPELAAAVIAKPGHELAATLKAWLGQGSPPVEPPPPPELTGEQITTLAANAEQHLKITGPQLMRILGQRSGEKFDDTVRRYCRDQRFDHRELYRRVKRLVDDGEQLPGLDAEEG